MLFPHQLLCIQHCGTGEFLLIHSLVNVHGFFRICRFHDQKELIVSKISFHRIVPALIPDIQKICKDLDINKFPASFMQAVAKLISRLFQLPWVCFLSLLQSF